MNWPHCLILKNCESLVYKIFYLSLNYYNIIDINRDSYTMYTNIGIHIDI